MNKREVIAELKTLELDERNFQDYTPTEWGRFEEGFEEAKIRTEHIIEQLDEPEKPVVPQFVADWIEECKTLKFELCEAMDTDAYDEKSSWIEDNSETFAKAWLYGYEVEKEKRYTVEIPNPNGSGYSKTYLCKNEDDKVELFTWLHYTSIEYADNWKQLESAQLTEEEIKEDYEWAWQFAVEVVKE
ncbi:Protein of unknown function [Streptococcus equinus]|uniref:DUF1642 domain-containing protein n=1 Tax=Streptococcus equinus TaxID=1335 RepID=A0A1H0YPB5_STREI|nr:DUF1642 domain-containing protein [Streptococcus equinus]QBX15784.1 hypothetical protein Javan213_0036 [Streptococcus phage Javan213]SDQ17072.1 Protein of unknown function [Streptococcus equinus]